MSVPRKSHAKKQPQPQPVPVRCRPTDEDGGFAELLPLLRSHFDAAVADVKQPLFQTDAGASKSLYDVFLENLPTELRRHYECRTCRSFVKRFGGLVTVDDKGRQRSVMWPTRAIDIAAMPEAFRAAVAALNNVVAYAAIVGVFLSEDLTLGTPSASGEDPVDCSPVTWTHFHAVLPSQRRYASLVKTLDAAVAERREEAGMLRRELVEFPPDIVKKALALLSSGTLRRPEKGELLARWLLELHEKLAKFKGQQRDNLIWLASATAPAGSCHVRSGMLGTLLEDLQNGLDVAAVTKRWAEKVDPAQYMRAQTAPAAGNLKRAEEIVARMEAAGALQRRYALRGDVIEFMWQPRHLPPIPPQTSGPIFGHIAAKTKPVSPTAVLDLPEQRMTLEKFKRTLLTDAERIEYHVPSSSVQLAALVTAVDVAAPPILQWDGDDMTSPRNPVSVYSQQADPQRWGLQPGSFVDVDFVTTMPYHWNGAASPQHKEGVLLALRGCRDQHRTVGGGFLPEFLRSEFREIRASLDAYARAAVVVGKDAAECCGLALMKTAEVATTPRVTVAATRELLVVDESGSMRAHLSQMQAQTEAIRHELATGLPDSTVEVCRFGNRVVWGMPQPAREIRSLPISAYMAATALYAAVYQATQKALASSDAVLIYVFTDGEENHSTQIGVNEYMCRSTVAQALQTGRITFACIGPDTSARFFASCGIPSGCVRFWSGRSSDLETVTQEVRHGIRSFSEARAAGRSSIDDFFTAPVSGFGDGVRLRVTKAGQRQVVVLDRWD